MKSTTEQRRIQSIGRATLLLLCLLQTVTATAATTTIIGIDLGISEESLNASKQLLKSTLSQAAAEDSFGMVIADELVRTVIAPQSAEALLAALPEITLNHSDSGNIAALLERSLAMADESAADTTRIRIISSGEIKLTAGTDNTSKQERFQMWASDILLPDIAARYPDFRLITPQPNNEVLIDAIVTHFGEKGRQLLQGTETEVEQLITSLPSDHMTITRIPPATKNSGEDVDLTTDADAEISDSTNDAPESIKLSQQAGASSVNSEESATNDSKTATLEIQVATTESDSESVKNTPEETNNTTVELKLEEQTELPANVDNADNSKQRSTTVLLILGAISILALIFFALTRSKKSRSNSQAKTHPTDERTNTYEPAPAASSPSKFATPPQGDTPATVARTSPHSKTEHIDTLSETILVSEPAISTDDATVITQANPTDATAVNASARNQHTAPLPNQVEDDFSAFDRLIIEKRWAKLEREDQDQPEKK